MNGNFKRNLVLSSSISMLILIISSTAAYISIKKLIDGNNLVQHTQEVISNLNDATITMLDAQASMRGFLITGKTGFLEQFEGSEQRSLNHIIDVGLLTTDNLQQQKAVNEFKILHKAYFKFLNEVISKKTKGLPTSVDDLNDGKRMMENIKTLLKRMETEERILLDTRNDDTERYGNYSTMLIIAAALISFVLSVVFFLRILTDYKQRMKLQLELEQNDAETTKRIDAISRIAGQIAQGNYDVRITDNESDALGSVSGSLNSMAQSLNASFQSLSDNEWLQAGVAQLNNVMIGEKSVNQLTNDVVKFLAMYSDSTAAALYLAKDDVLKFSAGYSFTPSKEREFIKFGEGLTGQAALSGKVVELHSLTPEIVSVSYAMGEVKPANVIAIPIIDDYVEGVIELASVNQFNSNDRLFFETVAHNIGIAVKAAQNRMRVQELLGETQAQTEELQMQHSELESTNAELEVQTEKLQASEEELKVQQEELQQTNEELAERSVLLEEKNTEIQKKSQDLERTTRYKSEFLANMSHELRTPLNSILLLSRLLSENNDTNMTEEQIEFANVINSSGNGLLGLIDEILDLSKIESGKMELQIQDVAVADITSNLKGIFSEMAKSKDINFKIDADDAPIVLKTDRMRLDQILKNLISNAIKFTSEGNVTLSIKKDPSNDKVISFVVKDSGIGIAEDKQHLIFEAFHQADGSTQRKYGGTGLGLSISRELAKLLKGEITVKSELGKGSEFTLSLPLYGTAIISASRAIYEQTVAPPKEVTDNRYVSATIPDALDDDRDDLQANDKIILIVEDDINFAKSLLKYTRSRGYKGIVSVRGDLALGLAITYKPVGVLLDIQLPIKSGWEVMEELKDNALTKHIPVHIMSSHKLKQESLLKGAVNFLEKPVAHEQMPEVFRRIEHIINNKSQKVLIIEDNHRHAKALSYFLDSYNINSEVRGNVSDGFSSLQKPDVDCVILDMGIPDEQSYDILDQVKKNPGLENLPIIVFTGKSLSLHEEVKIKKYADSIIVKTAHSYQRMLDEVSLFLHLMEDKKTGTNTDLHKRNTVKNVLKGKTVLVVDDDVRNIYSLTKALEGLQMHVITAIDGKEALNVLDANTQTDIVLLDMMMPNMDGYETATRIRKNPKLKNLPVIAVTAKAMMGDREKCINAGASDYITKPVDIDQLLSLLRVWLYD